MQKPDGIKKRLNCPGFGTSENRQRLWHSSTGFLCVNCNVQKRVGCLRVDFRVRWLNPPCAAIVDTGDQSRTEEMHT